MDEYNFTEHEIEDQLRQLGYGNLASDKLTEFKKDLDNLVRHEKSKNSSWSTVSEAGVSRTQDTSPNIPNARTYSAFAEQQRTIQIPQSSLSERAQYNHLKKTLKETRVVLSPSMARRSGGKGVNRNNGVFTYRHGDEDMDTSASTTASSDVRRMKRKVSRRVEGQAQIFNESSVSESDFVDTLDETDEIDRLRRNLMPAPRHNATQRPTTAASGERRRIYGLEPPSRPQSARGAHEAPEYYNGPVKTSLIKPMTSHPNMRNIKKTDPVNRHKDYMCNWSSQKAPGEDSRHHLRWNVREKLLYHDEVIQPKQHKVHAPNAYKAPAEKKRKNLIWQVRKELAQGLKPSSGH